jgi:hypothetical protein
VALVVIELAQGHLVGEGLLKQNYLLILLFLIQLLLVLVVLHLLEMEVILY